MREGGPALSRAAIRRCGGDGPNDEDEGAHEAISEEGMVLV